MRTISPLTLFILGPLVFSPQWAAAEVFKCTTAEGKTSYSQAPCTAAGAKEAIVPILAAPPGAGAKGRDWASENAAANARVQAATAAAATAASASAQKSSAPAKSTQQTIADCEANHGVNCSSAEEIARREADARPPTPEEAAAQQRAAAGRRAAEKADAQSEPKEKPKDKPPAQGGASVSPPAKAGK